MSALFFAILRVVTFSVARAFISNTFTVAWHVNELDLVSLAKEYVNDGYISDT